MVFNLLFFNVIAFSANVLGVFSFLAGALLFADSWKASPKSRFLILRSLGFFLITTSFALSIFSFDNDYLIFLKQALRIVGYLSILISLMIEPIIKKPETKIIAVISPIPLFLLPVFNVSINPLIFTLCALICVWSIRQIVEGLNKQLLVFAAAFFILSLFELTNIFAYWKDTTNVFWLKMLSDYSLFWCIRLFFQFVSLALLLIWIWGYLRFRFMIQLFMTILGTIFTIFLITTIFFTFILLSNLENDALSHLKTNAKMFEYSLNALKLESLANTRTIALDSGLKEAIIKGDRKKLFNISSKFLINQNLSTLVIASSSGTVMLRVEDQDNFGDVISDDSHMKSALSGKELSSLSLLKSSVAPEIQIKSAVPIKDESGEKIIGSMLNGYKIDNAFIDGIKDVTGLEVTIFAGRKRIASTILGQDKKSRYINTNEANENIVSKVLKNGELYSGSQRIIGEPQYVIYIPLKGHRKEVIGMFSLGKPQTELLETAQKTIELTFLSSLILMFIGIIPAFLLSKFIEENIQA